MKRHALALLPPPPLPLPLLSLLLLRVLSLLLALSLLPPPAPAQSVPPPSAIYKWTGTAWTPATTTATQGAITYTPPALGAHCYNPAIGQWVPADASCLGGSANGTVISSPQFSFFYQPTGGSSPTAQGDPNATTDGSGNVTVVSIKSTGTGLSPSASAVCPNGTGGALTTIGCAAGGGTVSGQTSNFLPLASGASALTLPSHLNEGTSGFTLDTQSFGATALISAGSPTFDIRHPSFSGGAACNNTHDDQPAFQAMINALFAASPTGGEVFVCSNAYFSNPTTISWPTFTGSFTVTFQGKFRSGTTFVTSGNGLSFNIKCMSGGQGVNFQSGQNCNITENSTSGGTSANHGTLGTAVSTTPGTGATVTFTPSTMSGLFAGTYITVTDTLTCTPTTVVRASNIVTATMPSSCKIPPGIFQNLTVAGMSDPSFNGTSFSVSQSDYVLNTVTWAQTGSNGSTSGGTITGFNEDTPETIPITSCTVSTCTATFYRPHLSTATWGVVGFAYINNTGKIDDASFSTTDGTSLYIFNGDFALTLTHMGVAGGGSVTNIPLEMDQTSFIKFRDSSISANNQSPWGLWLTSTHAISGSGTGNIELDHTTVSTGIKIDYIAANLKIGGYSFVERPVRGNIVVDPSFVHSGIASPGVIVLNSFGSNDNNGYGTPTCSVYYTSPSTVANPGTVLMESSQSNQNCAFNDYFNGYARYDSPQRTALITPRGPVGTYIDPITVDADISGTGASGGPSVIPYATQTATTNPASWSGTCTVTTGDTDPFGGTNAGVLTSGSNGAINVASWSGTAATGDRFLAGAWTYSSTLGTSDASGPGWGPVGLGAGGAVTWSGASNPLSGVTWDSNIADNGWHPISMIGTVATGGSTTINLAFACDSAHSQHFYGPFLIQIPASANVQPQEIYRWRRQLLHGTVPPSWNHPGVPVTVLPLASIPPSTTLTGTSGTALCSQGFQGTQKYTSCYLNGYAQTGTAQTFTFPVAFSTTPVLLESGGSCGTYNPSVSSTVLTLPANAAMTAETCNVVLLGQ